MFSSDDDDDKTFDQLKNFKAFTIEQLYLMFPDIRCPVQPDQKTNHVSADGHEVTEINRNLDQEVYQNLAEYERFRSRLVELKNEVKKLHKNTFEQVDKAWVFKENSVRKISMCQQGKIAETTFKYKQAFLNQKQLDQFSLGFERILDIINKDYIYYSFESQLKLNKITTQLAIPYHMTDLELREERLKTIICTLIDFIRYLGDSRTEFVLQCRKWFRTLVKRFLVEPTTDNYRFVISQIIRGPAGTADWCADLIACKYYNKTEVPQYISHCSALLYELFNNIRSRIKRADSTQGDSLNETAHQGVEQNWSYVDPRFSVTEELKVSQSNVNQLTESDVIKLCLKIPIAETFSEFVRQCLGPDDISYENIMLKLLTIGTVIIKTFQKGLETFDSIQYGNLVEYLSLQIRQTVKILSDQWTEFKSRLRGMDDALLMRLQVEYDNFILRSILVILELRESGIWRHLCHPETEFSYCDETAIIGLSTSGLRPAITRLLKVTGFGNATECPVIETPIKSDTAENSIERPAPKVTNSLTYGFSIEWFKEVSESMLWHILWQFYHNAFTSSCEYRRDTSWLKKFREKSSVYLFLKKMTDSSPGECWYLLNSLTSMLLSRSRPDSLFVDFIAEEIFNLSFKHEALRNKITTKATRSLILCAEKFPNLVSTYIKLCDDDTSDDVVDLIKDCSLYGWLYDQNEFRLISDWLVDCPLNSSKSKVARLILTKVTLNHANCASVTTQSTDDPTTLRRNSVIRCVAPRTVNLDMRRKLAILLYEASVRLMPDDVTFSTRSLGSSVEVAFEGLYRQENDAESVLVDLAMETGYQQLYVWTWRILSTLQLHILNQKETDWNDIQCRSGTSRSIKNTVLMNDTFHPVPSIMDPECVTLAEGVKNQSPMASFIYMVMTDATWQADTLDQCLNMLNTMVNTSHLTPSLLSIKYLTICHLNDLMDTIAKDKRSHEYFTAILRGESDAKRIASLIMSQLDHLKQYRQLQLSQFYVTVLFESAALIAKQTSSSWFSHGEHSLEKIACLLDFIVKFNFATQRREIIQKFYDSSYSIQGGTQAGSWFGYLVSSNQMNVNSTKREFLTTLHVLTQKFKKYIWLRWVTIECDTLRLEKIWENIIVYLNSNEEATLDAALKRICPHYNAAILKSMIPIHSWVNLILDLVEVEHNHPLCPVIWYNFFLNYFANSLNGVSVGYRLLRPDTIAKLMSRLDSLINYHLFKQRNKSSSKSVQQNSLAKLYRAYKLWLHDPSLRDAYVDVGRLSADYINHLLKSVLESSNEGEYMQYVDVQGMEEQNHQLVQLWSPVTRLGNEHTSKEMLNVEGSTKIADNETSDIASLIGTLNKSMNLRETTYKDLEQELKSPNTEEINSEQFSELYNDIMDKIKLNLNIIIDESSVYGFNISEIDKNKSEILELVGQLYFNKKREFVRVAACMDGNDCIGPARIKLEAEEAFIDERKNQCIQDRRRQCTETVAEMLLLPSNRTVKAIIWIENYVKQLIADTRCTGPTVESLLRWISEPERYDQLNGTYHVANHLLKSLLEILSSSEQKDIYNRTVVDVCSAHPNSVQIMSPLLRPSECLPEHSSENSEGCECFLTLYQKVSSKFHILGPMATFVLMSKFEVNKWLDKTRSKDSIHTLLKTTCSALGMLGKYPDEGYTMIFDIYKRHLQIQLAPPNRRKPEEIILVANQFLSLMDQQTLDPNLWSDFMAFFGLDKDLSLYCAKENNRLNSMKPSLNKTTTPHSSAKSDISSSSASTPTYPDKLEGIEAMLSSRIEDVARLADCQMIFDYRSLSNFMQELCKFFDQKDQSGDKPLLELYADYINQFSLVMLAVSSMWIKSIGDHYPDNHEIIWKQFIEFWNHWVFISKSCQNISKENYSLISNLFVFSIRYMINRIPDNFQCIMQSVLASLTNYVCETQQVVYLELTIMQRSLKSLPWSSFLLTPQDYLRLSTLSQQENYNISDLVSHILMQANIKDSLDKIYDNSPNLLPQVAENLAMTIILQSNHLRGFRLHGRHLATIPADHIPAIADLILPRMEFANLEHSQNNKLLVNLLRFVCIRLESSNEQSNTHSSPIRNTAEIIDRALTYGQFVSDYLINLIRNHPTVIIHQRSYLMAVIENSLQDLKLLASPDVAMHTKIALYERLLECCSSESIGKESRLLLADAVVDSQLLKNRPIIVLELLYAIGQIVRHASVLSHMVEKLVDMYLNMNGHYEKVWKSFCLRVLPSDIYLDASVSNMNPYSLLVYFESVIRNEAGLAECSLGRAQTQNQSNDLNSNSGKDLEHPMISAPVRVWSGFFYWLALLTTNCFTRNNQSEEFPSDYIKITTVWLRTLDLFESYIQDFVKISHKQFVKPGDIESQVETQNDKQQVNNVDIMQPEVIEEDQTPDIEAPSAENPLLPCHRFLVGYIKQLIVVYDSCFPGGFWSYIRPGARNEQSTRVKLVALTVASFLSSRTLTCLKAASNIEDSMDSKRAIKNNIHSKALMDEMIKFREICLGKLDAAKRSKYFISSAQFLETLMESIKRDDKVLYSEGVQLIKNYVKTNNISSNEAHLILSYHYNKSNTV